MDELKRAINDWDREVKAEAVKLIEQGTPPFDAVDHARDIVSARRKAPAIPFGCGPRCR